MQGNSTHGLIRHDLPIHSKMLSALPGTVPVLVLKTQ